jgi:hypothetical protein
LNFSEIFWSRTFEIEAEIKARGIDSKSLD